MGNLPNTTALAESGDAPSMGRMQGIKPNDGQVCGLDDVTRGGKEICRPSSTLHR